MRNFLIRWRKNWIWLSISIICIFAYQLFVRELPDHIYVIEGERPKIQSSFPIEVRWKNKESTDNQNVVPTISEEKETKSIAQQDGICYLFGLIPVKEIKIDTVKEQSVYASGKVIGIYEQTKGILVLKTTSVKDLWGMECAPAENKVFPGDYILEVDETKISRKEELIQKVSVSKGEKIVLTVERKGQRIKVSMDPVEVDAGQFLLGIWVKDDMAGIGTLTYYNAERKFGALGHGIGDGETGELLSVEKGSVYTAALQGIAKGKKGIPGELEGSIYYSTSSKLGEVLCNNDLGIYGILEQEDYQELKKQDQYYPIGYKQEIKKTNAYILSDISGKTQAYGIRIENVDYKEYDSNKSIQFLVEDDRLLAQTGGIVQGMSGSPIIQDGKLIGAVTHVLVNDPTRGYGIFIENML